MALTAHGSPGIRSLSHVLAGPLVLAVVYGVWAAGIHREGGPITGGNVLYGVVTGVAFGALYAAVRRFAPGLPRELRALAWATFAGVSFGFLYSLTDASVLRATGMAAVVAGGVFAATFYHFYTRE
ncbi:hypothetical protein [Streptomyces sp. AN091965]|uniref:hypothetical protein n=1 Tax=Streptomyces sp. AN091965 TaxID=2927803 RepID=UPI001F604548|nr:hypothetical protein [Streptomyces sp. AN091965]MCI3931915.1 hypothetical protein [Streptomyces sp. AN091965]